MKSGFLPLCLLLPLAFGCEPAELNSETQTAALAAPDSETGPTAMAVVTDAGSTEEEVELPPYPLSAMEGPDAAAIMAPVLTTLRTADEVIVEFIAVDEDSIGVAIEGPSTASAAIDAVTAQMAQVQSPAEFFLAVSPRGTTLPLALREHSARVAAAGHWNPGVSSPPAVAGPALPLAEPPASLSGTCNGVHALGNGNLHYNEGDCAEYQRDFEETTERMVKDNVGYAGSVAGLSGTAVWDVQKRNCNLATCDWKVIHKKTVQAGKIFYFHYFNPDNDFNAFSRVTSASNNGLHRHDLARCHDYRGRNNALASTLAGGCKVRFNSTPLFCSKLGYMGLDPSIIHTSNDWMGDGTPMSCL
ncbi:hypothetical protein [Pyxidicoccus trucidator]|uniref:hypothetical protein n=1 Tax=Pyxidicoccus trucidator TaxID=2709662 RepID=UPI0013DBC0E0|nr:hypothetical protein [Pyxidicoccus trucidator]